MHCVTFFAEKVLPVAAIFVLFQYTKMLYIDNHEHFMIPYFKNLITSSLNFRLLKRFFFNFLFNLIHRPIVFNFVF